MTQAEKAKRYDEALTKARNIVNSINVGLIGKDSFEAVFPELSESEDERIRKALVNFFLKSAVDGESTNGIPDEDILAWLEKQGEQKSAEVRTTGYWNVQDIEHTTALMSLDEAIKHCKEKSCGNNACALEHKQLEKWLTELKKLKEQKPAWSEEDENRINRLIAYFEDKESFTAEDDIVYANWLKSLRPQSHWKPSDEQMEALKEACDEHWEPDGLDPLYTLYQDLKKLKGEQL